MILIVSDEERGVSIPGVLNWSTQSPPLSVGLCCELTMEGASSQILGGQICKISLICLEGKSMTPCRLILFLAVPTDNFLIRVCTR